MVAFKKLEDLDVKGKRVLVRADLNVPIRDGKVTGLSRIVRGAETLRELSSRGARVVVCSHLGRPKGERNMEFTLQPVVEPLAEALGRPVAFADDCVGPVAEMVVNGLGEGDVALLENLRFHPEEEKNDPEFARKLATLADLYVNDAFSTSHRAHASTEYIAHLLPSAAGRLMQAELEALSAALRSPKRPVAAIVGGAKVSTKLELLGNLITHVDVLVIGGGMANTFLYAKGISVGNSLCEKEMADTARAIMEKAETEAGCRIILPMDAVVAREFREGAPSEIVPIRDVPEDSMILDVGPASVTRIEEALEPCHTIVWNGPLGAFEIPPFDAATVAAAKWVAERTKAGKFLTVAGGGDTVAAMAHAGVTGDLSYLSAAGGAFLEWLEGKTLPGVAALEG
ncbi:phosphoglycerate kinase [Phaeovibrio sulfidiphilus]|uniref:Phosphoglycerate kinase n=1 Tax=Phaeovibrio sulfidiphilus TaxID=1220600 RepID=A0A8J6YYU2_9PROT|nr:phosphoglycerate kinase [Phaeovibrio sulfidiphilus]MBE1237043.1 phosphoglycerate kinase [Phaeovibrio sulfidiphilus]